MPKRVEGLEQLLVEELRDLYDAEKQLVKALPRMAKSATDQELENALRSHLEVTKGQVQRLEQVFETMEMRARSRPCKGMKGIVEEGQGAIEEDHEENILNSAITAGARKVEHYEMVGYESVQAMARQLGMREAASLLQETLQEEVQADRQLAQISKRLLKEAGRPASMPSKSGRASSRSSQSGRSSASGRSSGTARPLTDHDEIRQWAERRGAHPACVRGTGGRADTGMIRLDFPGYSGEESLQPISWEDWFEKFDSKNLALLIRGDNFNKLVSRSASAGRRQPKTRAAR